MNKMHSRRRGWLIRAGAVASLLAGSAVAVPAQAWAEGGACDAYAGGTFCIQIDGDVGTTGEVKVYFRRNGIQSNDRVHFGWRTPSGATYWGRYWKRINANTRDGEAWRTGIGSGCNTGLMEVAPATGGPYYTISITACV